MLEFGPKIWMNGEFKNPEDATVSVMSHAIHYASSVFEGIKSYYNNENDTQIIFRLDDHVNRLFNSAKLYEWEIPYTKQELINAIIKLVDLNRGKDLYIRPCFFIGTGFKTIEITSDTKKNMIIACWELKRVTNSEYKLGFSTFIRPSNNILLNASKCSANYMNSILIRNEAQHNGYNDAIALNSNNFIAEISTANIFLIKDNKLYTPSDSSSILNGITRQSVITLAKELNIEVYEGDYDKEFTKTCNTLFITGTASELKLVSQLENRKLENHKIFEQIFQYFWDIINLKTKKHSEWITYVN